MYYLDTMKTEQYNYRCSKEDLDMLAKAAKRHKVASSVIIRNAVRFFDEFPKLAELYMKDRDDH